jgi:hypothetical protein
MSKAVAFLVGSERMGLCITPQTSGPRKFENRKLLLGLGFAFSLARLAYLAGLASIARGETGTGRNEDL